MPTGTTHQYTREALETVHRFSLSKLFPHHTLGTSHWGVVVFFFPATSLSFCRVGPIIPGWRLNKKGKEFRLKDQNTLVWQSE